MKIFYLSILLLFSHSLLFAQYVIQGDVYDEENNEPLIGASIVRQNTTDGTVADFDGKFSIEVDTLPVILEISYIGYTSIQIAVASTNYLEVKMEYAGDIIGCGPVIVEDSPIHLRMPAPMLHLRHKELNRGADLNIAPILNRVPGLYMQSGALNTNRITIRGIGNRSLFSTTKIRAYLDDIPLTTGDGETTIEDLDLSIISQVKVWKGPTASIYGAGLGGMIHLQTKNSWRNRTEDNYIESKTTLGSYGLVRNATDLYFSNKKNTASFQVNYNTTHSDGYRENNTYDRSGITVIGKVLADEKNETTLLTNFTKVKAFIPSSLNRFDYDSSPEKAAFSWGNIQGFEDYEKVILGLSHRSELGTIGAYQLHNKSSIFSHFRNAYESRPFNILEEASQSLGFRSSFNLEKNRGLWFPDFSIGIEAFQENYQWQTYVTNEGTLGDALSNNRERRNYLNLFAQSYTQLADRWTLLAGLNLNHTDYTYEDRFTRDSIDLSGDYSFNWILSPRLGLTYEMSNDLTVFATLSHGFSPPTLSETLTPSGTINPAIQPEQGWNFEVGSRGRLFYRLNYELTLYQMRIRDLLVAQRVGPDQFIGVNAGATRHNGLEAFVDYKPRIRGGHRISVFSGYTFQDFTFTDFVNLDEDFSGNQLTGTPPHQFNLGVDYAHYWGPYAHVVFQYLDAFPMRDDNSVYSDAYQVMNVKVGYRKWLGERFELNAHVGIRNLLDEKYASMILINAGSFGGNAPRYYYPGLPRNFYGGLALKWRY